MSTATVKQSGCVSPTQHLSKAPTKVYLHPLAKIINCNTYIYNKYNTINVMGVTLGADHIIFITNRRKPSSSSFGAQLCCPVASQAPPRRRQYTNPGVGCSSIGE
uniref:Uncharacterized protein n=1 Tax=Physcomitrium patens TaxID=3218 RepID=A0A2K1J175_PHYPA|nr:hypothetical protein PHYPA_023177 [Physcomitrium patens]